MNSVYYDTLWHLATAQAFSTWRTLAEKAAPRFVPKNKAEVTMQALLRAFSDILEDTEASWNLYKSRVRKILEETAHKIQEDRNFDFFAEFLGAIEKHFNLPFPEYLKDLMQINPTLHNLLLQDLVIIWMLLEDKGRFPVIMGKKRVQRKRIMLPEDPKARVVSLFVLGHQIIVLSPWLTDKDFDLFPERFAAQSSGQIEEILAFPVPVHAVTETLEDAWFHRHYTLHPMGALAHISKGQDIKGVFIMERGRVVVGRFLTPKGDILGLLDLETGKGIDFFKIMDPATLPPEYNTAEKGPPDSLSRILASVYHAFMVAKEEATKIRADAIPLQGQYPLTSGESMSITCIPRTVYTRARTGENTWRTPAILRRPPRFHAVRGHLRIGNMSECQRRRIEKWEQETGLSILSWVLSQGNRTFVFPHFSPSVGNEAIASLPAFIKRGVEAELIGSPQFA